MNDMRVIIKPKGLIALGALGATIVLGVVATQLGAKSSEGPKPAENAAPVGGLAKPTASPEAPDAIDNPGEGEEKVMLSDWNKNKDQARDWLFLGPLPSGVEIKEMSNTAEDQAQMDRIMNTVYLPNEAKYQAKENATFSLNGKDFTWKKVQGSAFDFKEMYHTNGVRYDSLRNMVVYGIANVESPKSARKTLRIRSDDGAIVWLNGDQVFKSTRIRGVRTEEETVPIKLREGNNTILVKVGQGRGGWGMMFNIEDPKKASSK